MLRYLKYLKVTDRSCPRTSHRFRNQVPDSFRQRHPNQSFFDLSQSSFYEPQLTIVITVQCTQCKGWYCYRKLSVHPSVCLSVTSVICGHIGLGWVTSKVITRKISLEYSLLGAPTSAIYSKGEHLKILVEYRMGSLFSAKTCSISETGQCKDQR